MATVIDNPTRRPVRAFNSVAEYIHAIPTRIAADLRADIAEIEESGKSDEFTAQMHMAAERELERRAATVQ